MREAAFGQKPTFDIAGRIVDDFTGSNEQIPQTYRDANALTPIGDSTDVGRHNPYNIGVDR